MDINVVEVGKGDSVLVTHNIGSMPPADVDAYCEKLLPRLKELFGENTVFLLPVREGETWDFTIVRKTS
jgi:hypothetical protein